MSKLELKYINVETIIKLKPTINNEARPGIVIMLNSKRIAFFEIEYSWEFIMDAMKDFGPNAFYHDNGRRYNQMRAAEMVTEKMVPGEEAEALLQSIYELMRGTK